MGSEGPKSAEGVFRAPAVVLRWSWGVQWAHIGLMSTECYWGIEGLEGVMMSPRGLEGSKGFQEVLKGIWGHDRPLRKYLHPSNPYDFSWTLSTSQDTSDPTGFLRTPWTLDPLGILGPLRTTSEPPQDRFRTSNCSLITPETPQNTSRPVRTPQGSLSPSGSHVTILLTS